MVPILIPIVSSGFSFIDCFSIACVIVFGAFIYVDR